MVFRASPILSKKPNSSSRSWLARQARDPYVRQRLTGPSSYRSRSAFKLLELDKNWGGFLSKGDVRAVVDLGAAPGGWSQVVAEKLGWINPAPFDSEMDDMLDFGLGDQDGTKQDDIRSGEAGRGVIVAVDLLPIAPIPGVHTLQTDFLSPRASSAVRAALITPQNPSGMADIILSDMAANFTGNRVRDTEMSLDICRSVFEFAKDNLRVRDTKQGTKGQEGGALLYVDGIITVFTD